MKGGWTAPRIEIKNLISDYSGCKSVTTLGRVCLCIPFSKTAKHVCNKRRFTATKIPRGLISLGFNLWIRKSQKEVFESKFHSLTHTLTHPFTKMQTYCNQSSQTRQSRRHHLRIVTVHSQACYCLHQDCCFKCHLSRKKKLILQKQKSNTVSCFDCLRSGVKQEPWEQLKLIGRRINFKYFYVNIGGGIDQ